MEPFNQQLPPWAVQLGASPDRYRAFKRRQAMGGRPGGAGAPGGATLGAPVLPGDDGGEQPSAPGENPNRFQGRLEHGKGLPPGQMRRSNEELQAGLDGGQISVPDAVREIDARRARPPLSPMFGGAPGRPGPPVEIGDGVPMLPGSTGPQSITGPGLQADPSGGVQFFPSGGFQAAPDDNPMLVGNREALAAALRARLGGMRPGFGGVVG